MSFFKEKNLLSKVVEKMRSEVLVVMKTTVFWDVTPCGLLVAYRRFRGIFCHHIRVVGGSKYLLNSVDIEYDLMF
jgi:hypothetical protein